MKRIVAGTLALVVLMLMPMTAYAYTRQAKEPADEGKSIAELNGVTQEHWASLCDDKLEYGEIKELVHFFNPNLDSGWNQIDDTARDMKNSVNLLLDAKKKTNETYDDSVKQIRNLPIPEEQKEAMIAQLAPLKIMAESVGTVAHQYNENYKKLMSKSAMTRGLYTAEDSLTYAVQSIMNAYLTVHANVEMLSQLVTLNREAVNTYTEMQKQGMATAVDVLTARADLVSAQSNLAKLLATDRQLYNQLITMCGWNAGDEVEIGSIPVPDRARVDAMNLETDSETAANSNAEIKTLRSSDHAGTSATQDVYLLRMEELTGYVKANMLTYYANVQAAQQGYDAACTGLEAARINKRAADIQRDKGLAGKAQYLGATVQYKQKLAAYTSAVNAYEQAIIDYENAIRGNVAAN
ncbi:MAG: TolC family protein [Lachnospiraceae bacterium]|nr:TolC family protein [Lachnospiraceae bacterium]